MAVIRQSDAHRIAEHAITLDLGDLRAQGEAMLARARQQAREVVDDGLAQRQTLIEGAAEVGRAQGYEVGQAEGRTVGEAAGFAAADAARREELATLERAWTAALEAFERDRAEMLLQARQDVLTLAVLLASRVVKRAIAVDPSLVVDQATSVLSAAARGSRLVLVVHPHDEPIVRRALPGVCAGASRPGHVELATDPLVERGSCTARTPGGGVVDGTIATQLDRIAHAMLGPGAGGAA